MDRVIVSVNQVVNDAGMAWMMRENFFEHGSGAHVGGEIAPVLGSAEDGERMEAGAINIVGKLAVQFGERGFVPPVAFRLRSLAEEGLHTAEIEFFPLRGGFGEPSLWRGRQAVEDLAGGRDIFLVPHRMILRHGFTPKGQGEIRSNLLGLAEVLGSIVVFEVVELRQAAEEVGLRGGGAGVGEGNFAD